MKKYVFFIMMALLFFATDISAQSAKKFFKTAQTFEKSGNYGDALTNYTKALEIDPEFIKAYEARAKIYEGQEKYADAIKDYERACSLKPDNEVNYYHMAENYFKLANYDKCIEKTNKVIELNKKYVDAYILQAKALIAVDKTGEAEKVALKAFDLEKNYETFYLLGEIYYLQKRYEDAEAKFKEAHKKDDKKADPLIMIAKVNYDQERYDEAINTVYQVFSIDPKNKEAYWTRALAFEKQLRYQDAINDLSQIIVYHPNADYIDDVYMKRGDVYFEFNQHINAINDYTKVIVNDPDRPDAYLRRAQAYEAIRDNEAAIKDYEKLQSMHLDGTKYKGLLMTATVQLYELKREENDPVLVINKPVIRKEGELEVIKGSKDVEIEGVVKDESAIKYLRVNSQIAKLEKRSNGKYDFKISVPVNGVNEFKFEVSDEYDNITKRVYKKVITETDPPQITLISPVASDDGQIYLESDEPSLYIEGTAIDASKIQSILIDSVFASFIPSALNPSFAATISILNKDKIWIEATDIYGNKKRYEYLLNREGAALAKDNPMGKTWVIFIENSNYQTFASLDGPTKDVSMMKAALSKYKIHNIIHKRDMTKAEMERFFSIELRDLVRKNHVNSIIVWYAGHGKFINNTGYWIPVDAKRDDEFTYFNINTLKASLQAYSNIITHTLVVTDACESGPTFYQAMRSDLKIRGCSDWKATKFKSSQVFSSAGYELASDNSQFTKTFANSLIHNPNTCIPIESIVEKVTKAVEQKNQQKPQFGKIDGLDDENGTFFFIRK